MQSFVIGLSSQRIYRDLFWQLATVAPLILFILVGLLALPRYRRAAAIALPVSAVGAALVAGVFHDTYALAIWGGHGDAIRFLDEGAFRAGFAATAVIYGLGLLGCWMIAKGMQRA